MENSNLTSSERKNQQEMALKKLQHKPIDRTHVIGRKRIIVSNHEMEKNFNLSSPFTTPSPKRRAQMAQFDDEVNRLELLPQDLLVKILCKTTHEDLKKLILVSKSINEVALMAKVEHFAYTTPRMKAVFRKDNDLEVEDNLVDSTEVPNAPMRRRVAKSQMHFASITAKLFSSFDDGW